MTAVSRSSRPGPVTPSPAPAAAAAVTVPQSHGHAVTVPRPRAAARRTTVRGPRPDQHVAMPNHRDVVRAAGQLHGCHGDAAWQNSGRKKRYKLFKNGPVQRIRVLFPWKSKQYTEIVEFIQISNPDLLDCNR